MKRAIAAILTLTILITGCSSGPTLTDAQQLWCADNWWDANAAGESLELKGTFTVWYESRGVSFTDIEGVRQDDIDFFAGLPDTLDEDDKQLTLYDAQEAEWFKHPDGIRACIAAYDSR